MTNNFANREEEGGEREERKRRDRERDRENIAKRKPAMARAKAADDMVSRAAKK